MSIIFFSKSNNFYTYKTDTYKTDIWVIRAMGFPTEFFPVLFAIPRMAGYLSHWRESLDDPDTKIMRPAQVRFITLFLFLCSLFFLLKIKSLDHLANY